MSPADSVTQQQQQDQHRHHHHRHHRRRRKKWRRIYRYGLGLALVASVVVALVLWSINSPKSTTQRRAPGELPPIPGK